MKFWISKYALTQGVFEVEGEISSRNPDLLRVRTKVYDDYYQGDGKEWHRTKESALSKADTMLNAKIKSVEKQLLKLKQMTFT